MPASLATVTEEAIREQAYYLWERDGRPWGRDREFWERAVAELTALKQRTATRKAAPRTSDIEKAIRAKAPAKPKAASKPRAAKPKADDKVVVDPPKARTPRAKAKA